MNCNSWDAVIQSIPYPSNIYVSDSAARTLWGTISKVLGELQVDEVHVDVLWSGT